MKLLSDIAGLLFAVCIVLGLLFAIVYPLAIASSGTYQAKNFSYESQTYERTINAKVSKMDSISIYGTADYELDNGYIVRTQVGSLQVGGEYRFELSHHKKSDINVWSIISVNAR